MNFPKARALRPFARAAVVASTAWVAVAVAQAPAQTMSTTEAQLRYERRLAECNVGTLAAPDRAACVRNAGTIYDSERSGLPTPPTATTQDGRATVVRQATVPAAMPAAPDASTTGVTTTDGRATVIVPPPVPQ